MAFQLRIQRAWEKIEQAYDSLAERVTEIEAAQAAADAAQADATEAYRESARIASYPSSGGVLSASDAGSSATISIAAHTRIYPVQGSIDVADVAIAAGSVTGLAYSTRYWIYYDDTTLANTAPTFLATTVAAAGQVGAAAGRHALGYIDTPASGGTATSGTGGSPPGGTGGGTGGAALP